MIPTSTPSHNGGMRLGPNLTILRRSLSCRQPTGDKCRQPLLTGKDSPPSRGEPPPPPPL